MSLGWKTNDVMSCFLSYFWVMKKEDTVYEDTKGQQIMACHAFSATIYV